MGEYGALVRVKQDIEDIVKKLSDRLGYMPFTIRNTALLYGLAVLALSKRVPETDEEFEKVVENVRRLCYAEKGDGD